ncbi:hypothetical protein FZC66_09955 [Priestia megaterium]|nr:hypothetical protein FZC66_09955 [Priestia megaterium]
MIKIKKYYLHYSDEDNMYYIDDSFPCKKDKKTNKKCDTEKDSKECVIFNIYIYKNNNIASQGGQITEKGGQNANQGGQIAKKGGQNANQEGQVASKRGKNKLKEKK